MCDFMIRPDVAKHPKLGERTLGQPSRDNRVGGAAKAGSPWRFEKQTLLDWLKQCGKAQMAAASGIKGWSA